MSVVKKLNQLLVGALVVLSSATTAQPFIGLGADWRLPSATRLDATSNSFTQLGYQKGNWSAVAQVRIPTGVNPWSKPTWLSGARLEWAAYAIPTDSFGFKPLSKVDWRVVVSGQWSRVDNHRYQSEHLGFYTTDHWGREIYSFQHAKHEALAGVGIQGRYGLWSFLAEVQYGPGPRFDTWVYKSELHNDGSERVIEDYYFYERYQMVRFSMTLRKQLGF
jgi:hypothetical protein